jgi:hypothetical protein
MSFLIALFRKVADSQLLLGLNLVAVFAAFGAIQFIALPLNAYQDGSNLPDTRLTGYTPVELNTWYDSIREDGCQVYVKVANWDFCPIMPSYVLLLGAVLSKLIRQRPQSGLSEYLAYLPVLTGLCDAVETYLQRLGCVLYPERLSKSSVQIASHACQSKWVLLLGTLALIVVLFTRVMFSSRNSGHAGVGKKE